jgi:beta-carotene 3-hydroxylase
MWTHVALFALVAVGTVGVMEVLSYLLHRFLMHGPGWTVHADHHMPTGGCFERNDLYPASFSALAVALFSLGTTVPALRLLVAAGVGMTVYGMAYFYVHEVCVHRRLPLPRPSWALLIWLERRHRIHHLYGGEPYGMLLPLVPRALRDRASADRREPFARAARTRESRRRL